MATNNSINVSTAGIIGFNGTAFVETSASNHAILIGGSTTSTFSNVGPTATSGQVLQSAGASADPAFSTAVYPSTTTINQVLYSSSANTITGLASAASSVFVTDISSIPSLSQTLPSAVQGNITTVGTISSGTWNGGTIDVAHGGTGRTSLTNHGVLIGASTSAITQIAAGSAGQVLQSGGASADPSYSTATYPSASGTSGFILTSNGTNWISAAPATSGTVTSVSGTAARITSTGGNTPIIDIDATYVGQSSITTLGTIVSGTWNGTTIAVANGGTGRTSLTNHGVLIGATTSAITQLAAGTAGQILQSGGASADPAYSTATYPSTAGTSGKILISDGTNVISSTPTYPNAASTALKHIKSDGTNFVTTTVTYPDASVTAGKMIVSDGTNYIASTPTFPNASATTRKMTVSDGTNWVASTETWAVPSTSGNILTSDGTNWTSATPAVLSVTGTLTNAQIKALHGTPIQIIAAPGVGKIISVVSATGTLNYGGTNVFTAAASQSIEAYWGTTSSAYLVLTNAAIVASSSQYIARPIVNTGIALTTPSNAALNLYNPVATEITGNAANNNTISYFVVYYIWTP